MPSLKRRVPRSELALNGCHGVRRHNRMLKQPTALCKSSLPFCCVFLPGQARYGDYAQYVLFFPVSRTAHASRVVKAYYRCCVILPIGRDILSTTKRRSAALVSDCAGQDRVRHIVRATHKAYAVRGWARYCGHGGLACSPSRARRMP